MADIPVGLSNAEIIRALATIQAQGEINNVPQIRLDEILAKARGKLELKPQPPIVPPPPTP